MAEWFFSTYQERPAGFTIIEIIVALGIVGMVTVAATAVLIMGMRYNTIIFDQLSAQADGRRAVAQIVDDIRRAESSSTGAYPVVAASSTEFIFYANIDQDTYRERVRYTLTATSVEKGVIKPVGTQLQYLSANEKRMVVASYVTNLADGIPLFTYFPATYAGTSTPMTAPITLTNVRVARVKLKMEKDANRSPVPISVEGVAHMRSFKPY